MTDDYVNDCDCADRAPPGQDWTCPKCDAEWPATDEMVAIPVFKSQAKELGTRPVVKPLTAGNVEMARLRIEASVAADPDKGVLLHPDDARAIALSMARQSLGGGLDRYAFEPFEKAARMIAEKPEQYPDRIAMIGGLSDASDLRRQDFIRLHEALTSEGSAGFLRRMDGSLVPMAVVDAEMVPSPAVTSPPKGEEEPVAWRWRQHHHDIDGPITGWSYGEPRPILNAHYRYEVQPLFTRPNPVSAELVEAGKAVEAAITAFANMALLAVPADHNPTVRAVLGEGLYNARERLRAALSAHAGEG